METIIQIILILTGIEPAPNSGEATPEANEGGDAVRKSPIG